MKIYSNTLSAENILPFPVDGVLTTADEWWFVYNTETTQLINAPAQCSGSTFTPHTVVVADTLAECSQYIQENNIS
jgi:hypothetical protein